MVKCTCHVPVIHCSEWDLMVNSIFFFMPVPRQNAFKLLLDLNSQPCDLKSVLLHTKLSKLLPFLSLHISLFISGK